MRCGICLVGVLAIDAQSSTICARHLLSTLLEKGTTMHRSRTAFAVLAVAGASLAVAACGDDDDSDSPTTEAPAEEEMTDTTHMEDEEMTDTTHMEEEMTDTTAP